MLDSITTLFVAQPSTLFCITVASFGVLTILLIPCVLAAPNADHGHAVAALAMYVLQFLGLVLVFAGASPVVLMLAAGVLPGMDIVQIPIIFLVTGVWMLVHFAHEVKKLDDDARALPHAIYVTVMHLLGIALLLMAMFSAALSLILEFDMSQWDGYMLIAIVGVMLTALFPVPVSTRRRGNLLAKARRK